MEVSIKISKESLEGHQCVTGGSEFLKAAIGRVMYRDVRVKLKL
jgi:hypothetical protein